MTTQNILGGTVHELPTDLGRVLRAHTPMLSAWHDITPLARNEFICWIISAKQSTTRNRRISVARSKLEAGQRRPCCWAGCVHREKNGT